MSTDAFYLNAGRNVFLETEYRRVVDACVHQGVELMPLKGMARLLEGEEHPGGRQLGDIDLLVRVEDVESAAVVLRQIGYRCKFSGFNRRKPYSPFINSMVFRKQTAMHFFIHLHWHLLNTSMPLFMFSIDMDDIWQAARVRRHRGCDIIAMAAHHELVYLCLHAFFHAYDRSRLLEDIAWFIKARAEELDWNAVLITAHNWRAQLPVYCSLQLAHDIAGAEVSGDIFNSFNTTRYSLLTNHFLASVRNRSASYRSTLRLFLHMCPTSLQKLRFLWQSLFPPSSVIRQLYAVNSWKVTAMYVKRLARLLH
jgi:hypothetical protein